MASPNSLPRRGRPPDLRKRKSILQAATKLFLARGFVGASMDAIAAAAGVSKLTVYSHFEDKERLFQEIVRARCDAYNAPDGFEAKLSEPLERVLGEIGRNFLSLLLADEALQLNRVMVAESVRQPRMAELFYAAGPMRLVARLADYLRRLAQRGELELDDPREAAEQFLSLVKGRIQYRALLNLRPRTSRAQAGAQVDAAVKTFLRAFAPRPASSARRRPR